MRAARESDAYGFGVVSLVGCCDCTVWLAALVGQVKALTSTPEVRSGRHSLHSPAQTTIPYGSGDDIPRLLKQVPSELELIPGDMDAAERGADIIRRTLSKLGAVAIGVAGLRHLYGTRHGKGDQSGEV